MWISCPAAMALSCPGLPSFPTRCREPCITWPWLHSSSG
jgi:hypothetical protein